MTQAAATRRPHGEVFTRRWVAEIILDLVGYTADRDLGALTIVEPSVGSGAFLVPLADRLVESARAHGRDLESLGDAVRAYDIQQINIDTCALQLRDLGLSEAVIAKWLRLHDFLLDEDQILADFVVGNPPYIRLEDLESKVSQEYRRRWVTMGGRADIFVGFYERGLKMLTKGGRLGFICADRWMRNQYGAGLRDLIGHGYSLEHVWSMHDVDAFEEPVSAYPAITVIRRSQPTSTVALDAGAKFNSADAAHLIGWVSGSDHADLSGVAFEAHRLTSWFSPKEPWPTGSAARLALIERLNRDFAPLHDAFTGTKVSIGVATGNDSVYVTPDAVDLERDRLLPLSMAADLKSGTFIWGGNYLVNPWDASGNLVVLTDYPKLSAYLRSHPELKARHVAQKSPANWFRTIDKVDPMLTGRPKLLLQDMRSTIHPVLESGGYYPHHNLYYVVSERWDMDVLGGILLSRIAQAFIEAYCVRMRGGTLRFQAQYLKRIRVPDPFAMPSDVAVSLQNAFRARDIEAATLAAAKAYGIAQLSEYNL
jgi:adenine-specific DNA-methyltransferase